MFPESINLIGFSNMLVSVVRSEQTHRAYPWAYPWAYAD